MGEFYDHYESDLAAAIDSHNDRKGAAMSEEQVGTVVRDLDTLLLAFSGYDLDLDELMEIKTMIGMQGLEGMVRGVPPAEIAGGAWVDGLITGLILAKKRAES